MLSYCRAEYFSPKLMLNSAEMEIVVIAFYKFVPLHDYEQLKPVLRNYCKEHGIMGTILLASEGINGMLGGSRQSIDEFISYIQVDSRFANIEWKESYHENIPFEKIKVRLKREIVGLGMPNV